MELCANIVESGFLRHRPPSRYCCYGNHASSSFFRTCSWFYANL